MASVEVESKMWKIILLSVNLAYLKFSVADNLAHRQEVIGQLMYSPSIKVPLLYSPSNYATTHSEVPLINSFSRQLGDTITPQDNCPQLDTLKNILNLLKRLVNQADNSLVLQPDKKIQILQSLKEYLERSSSQVDGIENDLKLKELLNLTDQSGLVENGPSQYGINNDNHKNHVEAQFTFRYLTPGINNVGCKDAVAMLIQSINSAHLQMINYCKQTGNCKLSSESDLKSNNLKNVLDIDPSKITPLNQNRLNYYDVQNTINNLDTSKNQMLFQKDSHGHLGLPSHSDSDLKSNQYLSTNNVNPSVFQTLNNQEKYIDSYKNIHLNKESRQLNVQHSNKANVLHNILNLHHPIPSQIHINPSSSYPLNIDDVKSLSQLNQDQELTPRGTNDYLSFNAEPQTYLDKNQFLTSNTLNTGVVQHSSLNNQQKNTHKYVTIYDTKGKMLNDFKTFINTPKSGIKTLKELNNPLFPLSHSPSHYIERDVPIKYENEPNKQRLSYNEVLKLSQVFNDNSASVAMMNQNKQNIKNLVQYDAAAIPIQEHNSNYNYLPFNSVQTNEMKNFATGNVVPSNLDMNIGQFRNRHKQIADPTFYSNLNMQQNPYTNSISINRKNSFNHNSHQGGATIQGNLGFNLYSPKLSVDYPKHDIYGNTLFDLHRLAAVPNLVKLKPGSDNEGIVELTFQLRRPQSLIYKPYYYIKYRMPYKEFISNIADLSKNPQLRANSIKLQELLSVSKLAETSPDLKHVESAKLSKLILNNGGTLVNAVVLDREDSNADQYLKTIQNLNANLNTNSILNLIGNDKKINSYTSLNSNSPIYRQEQNMSDGDPSYQNSDEDYVLDAGLRRLEDPIQYYDKNSHPISYLPTYVSPFGSQIPNPSTIQQR